MTLSAHLHSPAQAGRPVLAVGSLLRVWRSLRVDPVVRRWRWIVGMLVLAGCAPVTTTQDPVPVKQAAREAAPMKPLVVDSRVAAELDRAASQPPRAPDASQIQDALLPPLRADMPGLVVRAREPRFDIAINNAPASQVFLSIVSGTRYSLLLHPEVAGNVTLTLKDTTVREALDALRDLYGYEYRIEGARIFVQPAAIQTRLFRVNYMVAQRLGRSDIRVPAEIGRAHV